MADDWQWQLIEQLEKLQDLQREQLQELQALRAEMQQSLPHKTEEIAPIVPEPPPLVRQVGRVLGPVGRVSKPVGTVAGKLGKVLLWEPVRWVVWKPLNYVVVGPLVYGLGRVALTTRILGMAERIEQNPWEKRLDNLSAAIGELGLFKLSAAFLFIVSSGVFLVETMERGRDRQYQAWSVVNTGASVEPNYDFIFVDPETGEEVYVGQSIDEATDLGPEVRERSQIRLDAGGEPVKRVQRSSTGEGGRIKALQELYADNQSLAGLQAPGAYLPKLKLEERFCLSLQCFISGYLQKRVDLSSANLEGASLRSANLEGAYLWSANLEGAYLGDANLEGASLESTNLEGADLGDANLEGAYLESANLEGASLWSANLEGAYLESANLEGAYLESVNLEGAYLESANLEGAYLESANLEGAYLESANLEGAYLWSANLEGAYLWEANLEGAYLWEANLEGAVLLGSNLLKTFDFTPEQLSGAYLCVTNLPPEFEIDGDRDCEKLLSLFVERYGWSIEDAQQRIDEVRQRKENSPAQN